MVVQDEWLSSYCNNLKEKLNLPSDKTTKLIPTLFNRNKYLLHISNLQLYLKLGIKLTKIHIVLQFKESHWLAKYIAFNTNIRSKAKHDFEGRFLYV